MGTNTDDWRQIQERLALIGDDDDDDDEEAGVTASDDRDEESFASVTKNEKSSALAAASAASQPAPPAKWTNTRHTPSQRRACMRISALALCLLLVIAAVLTAVWPKGGAYAPHAPGKGTGAPHAP
ncbi:hypothetical protein KFE25_008758 [Diacronema lutheri]|uniref:Uncharacterized protein n=2 Tax=Diacronema lutheri TaxID=2081491 RepID=A0A8J5XX59_DIALT|nr:hypothetical protein KFE25_008758 [Diacronema lutheri]